jgi:hypothetical protein
MAEMEEMEDMTGMVDMTEMEVATNDIREKGRCLKGVNCLFLDTHPYMPPYGGYDLEVVRESSR